MTTHNPVVAALPGGGWRARFKGDDGSPLVWPITCWLIKADGSVVPIDVDCYGIAGDPTESSNFDRLLGPDDDDEVESP
ncbi:hypothetical protein [Streptomyces smyrnaeus]|uniref:hypothetical protein n=1 Tax=Streptomyces smyrnaeus TaxID=1387713 RepID=UPI0033C482ED